MADFKIKDNHSRIDIVFLFFFFVLLFIPMLNISTAEKSTQENRMLAKYIPFYNNGKINENFGTDFEEYFNDRFFGRDFLMDVNNQIKYKINYRFENNQALRGENNWLIHKHYLHPINFSEESLENITSGVEEYLNFCKKNNIKCYINVAPIKTLFVEDNFYRIDVADFSLSPLVDSLKKELNFDLIYPYSQLVEANKTHPVYFKTDHHLTEWGAYFSYVATMKAIQKDFPDVKIVTLDDFDVHSSNEVRAGYDKDRFGYGSTCNVLRLSKEECVLDTEYKYYKHKDEASLKIDSNKEKFDRDFYYPKGANYKVVIIGNSFTENFTSFLPYSFKNVKKLRCNHKENNLNFSRWKEEVIDYKPDIMMIVIHTDYFKKLQDLKE